MAAVILWYFKRLSLEIRWNPLTSKQSKKTWTQSNRNKDVMIC